MLLVITKPYNIILLLNSAYNNFFTMERHIAIPGLVNETMSLKTFLKEK